MHRAFQWIPGSIALLAAAALAATGDGSPQDANLLYVGRWDVANPSSPHSYWGGAYLRAGFTGTSISVKLGKSANLAVYIDNKAAVYKANANGTVSLATGLAAGNHTIKLVAKAEADQIVFNGFVLDAGAKTIAAEKSKGWIEFIGNSITSGTSTTNGNTSAFAWLVGEDLGCDRSIISYPGITLVNGYSYNMSGGPSLGMNLYWDKTVTVPLYPDKTVSTNDWDFRRYTPDIVVLNLGTNDQTVKVPSAEFQTAYGAFLKHIRTKFPKAHVFGMRTYGGYFEAEVKAATESVAKTDTFVRYINTTGWLASADYADGVHPTDAGHKKILAKLSPILKPYVEALQVSGLDRPAPVDWVPGPALPLSGSLRPSLSPLGRNTPRRPEPPGPLRIQAGPPE